MPRPKTLKSVSTVKPLPSSVSVSSSVQSQQTSNTTANETGSSLITIFTADSFVDPNEEIATPTGTVPKTPDSEKADLDDLMNETSHLFITSVHDVPILHSARSGNALPFACYSIENAEGQQILIAEQVGGVYYDKGKLSIAYDVYNRFGHLLFTTDGQESTCGMKMFIRGHGEVTRGKVFTDRNCCNYEIKDYLTGQSYSMSIPWWMELLTCFLYCTTPSIRINSKVRNLTNDKSQRNSITEKLVAKIGAKKWPMTIYDDRKRFALCYEEDANPDTKLFLFSATLVVFHLYYKSGGKKCRCLTTYLTTLVLLGLLILVLIYIIFVSDENGSVPTTNSSVG